VIWSILFREIESTNTNLSTTFKKSHHSQVICIIALIIARSGLPWLKKSNLNGLNGKFKSTLAFPFYPLVILEHYFQINAGALVSISSSCLPAAFWHKRQKSCLFLKTNFTMLFHLLCWLYHSQVTLSCLCWLSFESRN